MRLVGAAEDAAISLVHRGGRIYTPAATSDVARRVDKLQYELDQGPCLDAIRKEELVLAPDLATDTRWSQWGSRVASETGIRSMMCLRLFTYAHTVGALNLYARSRNAFGRDDIEQGQALAAHAAVAVVGAQRIDQLSVALDTRTVIAQAQGILMERYRFTADQAFNVLVRVSSQANAKLRDVAIELVETRRTPGHKPPKPPDADGVRLRERSLWRTSASRRQLMLCAGLTSSGLRSGADQQFPSGGTDWGAGAGSRPRRGLTCRGSRHPFCWPRGGFVAPG